MMLTDKVVVLGVTGSIAAYKAVDIASKLTQAGARVEVILTESAQEFITPLTFRSLTHRQVITDMFDPASEYSVQHVSLAEQADVVLIAPATANLIAKLANGLADDMLSCTVLATRAPVIIAPGMNVNMYENAVTQNNIARLRERDFTFVGPVFGRLATGIFGQGRFAETEDIIDEVRLVLGREGELAGKRVVVSAGGTQEAIDPVRFISNRSSGKMGYALAAAARDRGADVILVSAPTCLRSPGGVEVVNVQTAVEMRDAIQTAVRHADALIMAAAVADYKLPVSATAKIKKGSSPLTLKLELNPDILSEVHGDLVKVGFAAESDHLLENARDKLEKKRLDFIVANDIMASDSGFAVDTNRVIIIDRNGNTERLPLLPKDEVAEKVMDKLVEFFGQRV